MLSVFEKGIMELIKSSLSGEAARLEDGFSFDDAYEFAQNRQITPLLYYGAISIPGFMDTIVGKKFFKSTMNMSFYCAEQSQAVEGVCEAFKQNKIQHLVVKGTLLKDLYPYPEMRLMSDADILIKEEEYSKIKPIMVDQGFSEEYESDHELVWKKGDFTIELHKRLIPSYNKDYYEYFGDGWKLATVINDETKECKMSSEDSFIYNFVHYAMHYRNGGIGIKHVTDFYVIMSKNPSLDFEYIEMELEKLQLLKFWKNTKKLLDVWFNSVESDELVDHMTVKIFDSGAYGTVKDRVSSSAVRTGNVGKSMKLKRIFKLIFPSYSGMCQKYRFLKKVPILLPFMWVARWIQALFTPSKIRKRKKELDMLNKDSVSKFQSELDYVGLSFNFE